MCFNLQMLSYTYPTAYSSYWKSQEYHDNIGDLDGPEEKERAQARIQKFISAFGWSF